LLGEQLGLNGSPGFESLSHRQQKITLILELFFAGGVRSKKFEQISPKICRTGGIPPNPPFRPPTEATLSD